MYLESYKCFVSMGRSVGLVRDLLASVEVRLYLEKWRSGFR